MLIERPSSVMDHERAAKSSKIGESIRRARKSKGIGQSDLAKQLDISFQMLQKYEQGVSPLPSDRLLEISEVLKVSLDDMLQIPKARRQGAAPNPFKMVPVLPEEGRLLELYRGLKSAGAQKVFMSLLELLPKKEKR